MRAPTSTQRSCATGTPSYSRFRPNSNGRLHRRGVARNRSGVASAGTRARHARPKANTSGHAPGRRDLNGVPVGTTSSAPRPARNARAPCTSPPLTRAACCSPTKASGAKSSTPRWTSSASHSSPPSAINSANAHPRDRQSPHPTRDRSLFSNLKRQMRLDSTSPKRSPDGPTNRQRRRATIGMSSTHSRARARRRAS